MGSSVKSIVAAAAPAIGTAFGGPVGGAIGSAVGGAIAGRQYAKQAGETAAQYNARMQQLGQKGFFRPVGVSTLYGQSQFEIDPSTGALKSAGYTASPEVIEQQQRLGSLGDVGLTAAERAAGYLPQYEAAGQGLFSLGQQFLPTGTEGEMTAAEQEYLGKVQQLGRGLTSDLSGTPTSDVLEQQARLQSLASQVTPASYDPTAAAQSYFEEQQALLDPARRRQEQRLASSVFGRGRGGLSVGPEGQPELFALGQARAEEDARLAAQARERARGELREDIALGTTLGTQGIATGQQGEQYQLGKAAQGIDLLGAALTPEERARQRMFQNIEAGTGLLSQGAGTIGTGYNLMQGALAPYQSYLANQSRLEQLAQQPLTMGANLGATAMSGSQFGAEMGMSGAAELANQQMAAAQRRNELLSGVMGSPGIQGAIGTGLSKVGGLLGNIFTPGGGIGGGINYGAGMSTPGLMFGQRSLS